MSRRTPSSRKIARTRIAALFEALKTACQPPPPNITEAIRNLPPVGELPLPWTTSLLLYLCAHRARQIWGQRLLRDRLPQALSPTPAMCKRNQPVEHYVPGAARWRIRVECGFGFTDLIHRVTGESMMVDHGTRARGGPIRFNFHDRVMRPAGQCDFSDRLRELHSRFDTVWLAIEELELAGIIRGVDDYGNPMPEDMEPDAHRLTSRAVKQARLARDFQRKWAANPSRRLWMAAVINDWPLVHRLAADGHDQELADHAADRAEQCREARLAVVRDRMQGENAANADLYVLEELDAPEFLQIIERMLRSDAHSAQGMWYFFKTLDDPQWVAEVFELLRRVVRKPSRPIHRSVAEMAEYLCRHGHRVQETLRLAARNAEALDTVVRLALEHAPDMALHVSRRALRHRVKRGRQSPVSWHVDGVSDVALNMAILLAAIDEPWTRRELYEVLAEAKSDGLSWEMALPCVAALAESKDPEARQTASAWRHVFDRADYESVERLFFHFVPQRRSELDEGRPFGMVWLAGQVS
jgi:hypothetical protein